MIWFERLTGLNEESPKQVRSQLSVHDDCLVCPDGRRIAFGRLETPTLGELRSRIEDAGKDCGKLRISEVVADVRKLHLDVANANALFQVASQFNLLEMAGPDATPERGVGSTNMIPRRGRPVQSPAVPARSTGITLRPSAMPSVLPDFRGQAAVGVLGGPVG